MSDAIDNRKPYITVTEGMSGYFAVLVWWNADDADGDQDFGFWEPYETGMGRYANKADAIAEARYWAEAEELELVINESDADIYNNLVHN